MDLSPKGAKQLKSCTFPVAIRPSNARAVAAIIVAVFRFRVRPVWLKRLADCPAKVSSKMVGAAARKPRMAEARL